MKKGILVLRCWGYILLQDGPVAMGIDLPGTGHGRRLREVSIGYIDYN